MAPVVTTIRNTDNVYKKQNELIAMETVSKDKLNAILDSAFMESSYDEDGDLVIKYIMRFALLIVTKAMAAGRVSGGLASRFPRS